MPVILLELSDLIASNRFNNILICPAYLALVWFSFFVQFNRLTPSAHSPLAYCSLSTSFDLSTLCISHMTVGWSLVLLSFVLVKL